MDKETFELILFFILMFAGVLLLINNKSYEEIYIAVNKTRYRHIYYIAKCDNIDNNINLFNPNNKIQIKEVKDVKWLNYNNVINIAKNCLYRTLYFLNWFI